MRQCFQDYDKKYCSAKDTSKDIDHEEINNVIGKGTFYVIMNVQKIHFVTRSIGDIMQSILSVIYNILYLLPIFAIPILVGYYLKDNSIPYIIIGSISGGAIGLYLTLANYFLFTKLFLSDVLFHVNLFFTSFIYAFIHKMFSNPVTQADPQHMTNTIFINSIILIILYGCSGAVVGVLISIVKK